MSGLIICLQLKINTKTILNFKFIDIKSLETKITSSQKKS